MLDMLKVCESAIRSRAEALAQREKEAEEGFSQVAVGEGAFPTLGGPQVTTPGKMAWGKIGSPVVASSSAPAFGAPSGVGAPATGGAFGRPFQFGAPHEKATSPAPGTAAGSPGAPVFGGGGFGATFPAAGSGWPSCGVPQVGSRDSPGAKSTRKAPRGNPRQALPEAPSQLGAGTFGVSGQLGGSSVAPASFGFVPSSAPVASFGSVWSGGTGAFGFWGPSSGGAELKSSASTPLEGGSGLDQGLARTAVDQVAAGCNNSMHAGAAGAGSGGGPGVGVSWAQKLDAPASVPLAASGNGQPAVSSMIGGKKKKKK
ncbi:hypothetical protein T484DRAFT_1974314 [Baffinella frigidus]|nr:hypothetical protein T484DRAFT_1974314 [Cryptophyta sp. CCMP2293]